MLKQAGASGAATGAAGEMENRSVEVGEGRIRATLIPQPCRAAPLVVLVHGGGCHSGYFDLPGRSLLQAARGKGFAVLLVDRPGHGASLPAASAYPIAEAAALLADLVDEITRDQLPGVRKWALVGHSIGGAVALQAAALTRRAAPDAIVVSGIGATPTQAAAQWFEQGRTAQEPPPAAFFFGPDGTFEWSSPLLLRRIAQPWRFEEVREVLEDWPARFGAVAVATPCPVLFALAEHEAIWRSDACELKRVASLFGGRASCVSLPAGAHLYELHKRGGAWVDRQLSFLSEAFDDARRA